MARKQRPDYVLAQAASSAHSLFDPLHIVPVKRLLRDLPLALTLQQREHFGNPGIRSRQLSGPALHFQVDDRDRLEDFDAREPGLNIWGRAVRVDPIEKMLDRAAVLEPLTIPGGRRF